MELEVFAAACVPLVERAGGLLAGEEAWTLGFLELEEGLHPFVVAVTMVVVVAQVAVITAEVVLVLEVVAETAAD